MMLAAGSAAAQAVAPHVRKKPFQVPSPNGARQDDYYWLRDDTRKNPEMLTYLAAENAYADAQLAPLKPLRKTLYDETVAISNRTTVRCQYVLKVKDLTTGAMSSDTTFSISSPISSGRTTTGRCGISRRTRLRCADTG